MIGITGQQFLDNSMGWDSDKLAILFMACYERPSYNPDVNHWQRRKEYALQWYEYMGGVIPPTPPTPFDTGKTNINIILLKKKRKKGLNIIF